MEHRQPYFYTASHRRNPGRSSWLAEFRHPLKLDNAGKPGRKMRKGLGTEDEDVAKRLVEELNQLLSEERLWSLGAKPEAQQRFSERVVEVFYSEIEPRHRNARDLREKYLPLPARDSGYARALLLGVPGAGKTTLVRQLIGTHPKRERFPSTSVNRTTTFLTELITRPGEFTAIVTFLSEHETRFEIEESVSSALLAAIEGTRDQAATAFLEQSDMRFRLKYVLGDVAANDEDDPYKTADEEPLFDDEAVTVSESEGATLRQRLNSFLDRIFAMASQYRADIEAIHGQLNEMRLDDKNAALDLIQMAAEDSDDYVSLVSDVLDELRGKFDAVTTGKYDRSTAAWPLAWRITCAETDRSDFLKAVRSFSGISIGSWGQLLTPLVNGIRVAGPFRPSSEWNSEDVKLVLMDTEGLSHKANVNTDLPEHMVSLFDACDSIVLVDSAKNSLTHFAAAKALEAVVSSGHTRKLMLAFTHMDAVTGENLRGKARLDHVFGGVRNVVENQVVKTVSIELARYLLDHLGRNTFYLGQLDRADPAPAYLELQRLLKGIQRSAPEPYVPVAFPAYGTDKLVLAIQEGARDFRQPWRAWLGIEPLADLRPYPWQSLKAMSRRYAEGWDDGYHLQPSSNLLAALQRAISRFLETPLSWNGAPTADQKREVMERIKALVAKQLPDLSRELLRDKPQKEWLSAYKLHGGGSTLTRRIGIETIFEKSVPIPHAGSDRNTQDFLDRIKEVVLDAIKTVELEVHASRAKSMAAAT